MQGFAEFWRLYPRKVGKGAAERAWPKALAAVDGDVEAIVGAVKVGLSLGDFDLRENARFCPHAATWLNGKRWLDGLEDIEAGGRQRRTERNGERNRFAWLFEPDGANATDDGRAIDGTAEEISGDRLR